MDTVANITQQGESLDFICVIVLAIIIGKLVMMWSDHDTKKGGLYRRMH